MIQSETKLDRFRLKLLTFMDICGTLAKLSHDSKYKVATIIVSGDLREICAIGYNGDVKGGPNERSNFDHGQSGFLHSEENALIHLNKPFEIRDKLMLFCTHKPCTMCAKRIVNSGIKRIIYRNDYSDAQNMTDEIFSKSKVICVKLQDLMTQNDLLHSIAG
jgi:dCMP deaminase